MVIELEDKEKAALHGLSVDTTLPSDSVHSLGSDVFADRRAFLSSFSPEEDKAIRRKVDWKFLWLIGLMYIIKNVRELELGRLVQQELTHYAD
jgi:hypothetical protein